MAAALIPLRPRLRLQVLLPCLVAAVYCLPRAFSDPPLAGYVLRGVLGCVYALALWRGWRVGGATALCVITWEGAAVVCGSLYTWAEGAWEGMCDRGTGVPWTYPSLAVTVAATVAEGRRRG